MSLLASACSLAQAQQATAPATALNGKKVCVADIANSSMQPMFTDRVKQALVEALQGQNINAENTYTVTMLANHLAISGNNKIVFRREKCGFMLLSEVAKAGAVTTPATATGDPPSAPVPLSFDFALFKKGKSAPLREDSVPVPASEDPTSATSAVVQRIAAEVAAVLKSK